MGLLLRRQSQRMTGEGISPERLQEIRGTGNHPTHFSSSDVSVALHELLAEVERLTAKRDEWIDAAKNCSHKLMARDRILNKIKRAIAETPLP